MTETQNKFLAVEVNGQGYGIPIDGVREIVYHTQLNALPQTPDFVRGVSLIRDETIPVLDLNILLGGEELTTIHDESCFIVLQLADSSGKLTQICLLADHILQSYKVDSSSVDSSPAIAGMTVINYVLGITRIEERIFILIDTASLITPLLEIVDPYVTYDKQVLGDEKKNTDAGMSAQHTKRTNNKFLAVVIDGEEYAFPISTVSQVLNSEELTGVLDQNKDIPDILTAAAIFNNKPLAIVALQTAKDEAGNPAEDKVQVEDFELADKGEKINSREVIVMMDFCDGLLGIKVDRIERTYETTAELKQNSFCTDLQRNRIKSIGFIDDAEKSIEVIDPLGVVTDEETKIIDSWIHCIARMYEMSEKNDGSDSSEQEVDNPYAKFAGSYLIVEVGEVLIGLNNIIVDEVLTYADIIDIKGGPKWFPGLLDLRGDTYPVIDLHNKLDILTLSEKDHGRNVMVMINHGSAKIGLMVDAIVQSTHVDMKKIEGVEKSKLYVHPGAIHAVANTEKGMVHIINLEYVLSEEEISARRLMEDLQAQSGEFSTELPIT